MPFFQFERRELYIGGEDVPAFRSEGGIEERGYGDVEIGSGGKFAVLGGGEGAVEIIGFGADVDAAGKRFDKAVGGDGVSERGKGREIAESAVDVGDGAVRTKIFDAQGEGRIEMRRIDGLEKGAIGIEAGARSIGGGFCAPRRVEIR